MKWWQPHINATNSKSRSLLYLILQPIIVFFVTIIFSSTHNSGYAQDPSNHEGKVLASFIYNVVDYVEWSDKRSITLCVYGYDHVSLALTKLVKKKHTLLYVKNVTIVDGINLNMLTSQCNMLYIALNKEKYIVQALNKAHEQQILTVSNINNFTEYGGALEVHVRRNQVALSIGIESVKKSGATLSPLIIKAAQHVIPAK